MTVIGNGVNRVFSYKNYVIYKVSSVKSRRMGGSKIHTVLNTQRNLHCAMYIVERLFYLGALQFEPQTYIRTLQVFMLITSENLMSRKYTWTFKVTGTFRYLDLPSIGVANEFLSSFVIVQMDEGKLLMNKGAKKKIGAMWQLQCVALWRCNIKMCEETRRYTNVVWKRI